MELYAKSNPPETIKKHTEQLDEAFKILKAFLPVDRIEKYAAAIEKMLLYHDAGKANPEFQNRLYRKIDQTAAFKGDFPKIPHEWLSPAFISDEDYQAFLNIDDGKGKIADLILYSIAFHHARSFVLEDEEIKGILETMNGLKEELQIPFELEYYYSLKSLKNTFDTERFRQTFSDRVLFKGILHKCDYAASAGIASEVERSYDGDYRTDFEHGLPFEFSKLRNFQKAGRAYRDQSVVQIASTGMGKTELSMNWIDGDKAFYLLGLKTAVEKMYDRFKALFGENVTLLHGESMSYLLEKGHYSDDASFDIEKARVKQLSYPLTVATADQLVISAFKFPSFEWIYLTMSYSKVVVDEIQSFSPESIAVIITFLKEIHQLGGRFLLMTATLPPFIAEELSKIAEFPAPAFLEKKRHRIRFTQSDILDETSAVREHFKAGHHVLVICNTVKKAQAVAEALKDCSPELLHSHFLRPDRKAKEKGVMEASATGAPPCIWVSTQIVEASLDIDFDVLFSESAPVDSLFQRFGRCFRKRPYTADEPNVFITEPGEWASLIYDKDILERSIEVLQKHNGELLSEEIKQEIIDEVYDTRWLTDQNPKYWQNYKRYKDLLTLGFRVEKRAEAQELFRRIRPQTEVIPKEIYEQNEDEIQMLLKKLNERGVPYIEKMKMKERLKDFLLSVNLYDRKIDLKPSFSENYFAQIGVKVLMNCEYKPQTGLILTEKMGSGEFS